MKNSFVRPAYRCVLSASIGSLVLLQFLNTFYADASTKSATGTDLNAGTSWGGTAPTAADVAGWDSTSLGAGLTLGSSVSWNSINITGALSDIVITGGGAIQTGNITLSGNRALSIANAIRLSGNSVYSIADVTGDATTDATLSGIISGVGFSITKSGNGTLTLSGANTYSGGTTIGAGTVIATVAGALGTGAVTNNGTLNLTAGAVTYTGLSSSLTGNGTVNVTLGTGSATTTLNGDYSNFTGTWNIGVGAAAGAGKAQMNGLDNAAATVNLLTNSTLYISSGTVHKASLVLNGGDTGESIGQLRLEGGVVWSGAITLAGDITGTGDGFIGSNTGTAIIAGAIGESGGSRALSKVGGGTLVLTGTNTYSGATLIGGGSLLVSTINNTGVAGNLGTGGTISLGLTGGSGTLNYTGAGETTNRVINWNGTSGGGLLLNNGSGLLRFTANTTTTGAGDKGIFFGGAGNGQLDGTIVNNGGVLNITKQNAGTWTLNGNITTNNGGSASALTVSGGTLNLGGTVALGAAANINGTGSRLNLTGTLNQAININAGALLSGTGSTTGNITFAAGAGIVASPVGSNAVQGATVSFAATTNVYVVGVPSGAPVTAQVIRYTGATPGTANLSAATNYRAGSYTDASNTISLNYTAKSLTWDAGAGAWDAGTTAKWNTGADQFFWGDAVSFGDTTGGAVTLTGNLAPSSIAVSGASGTYTFSGTGSIVGVGALTKSGGGTLSLGTANTYTGGTTISGGTIAVTNATALGSGALTFAANSTLNTNLAAGANITNDIVINSGVTASFTGANFNARLSGVISGAGAVSSSSYTLLTGVNTYTGGTTITGFLFGINSDAALGAVPGSFSANNITLNGGTLSNYTGSYTNVTLNANRGIFLGASGGTIDNGATFTINGVISGTGSFGTATGGTTILAGLNTYSGKTTVGTATTLSVASIKNVNDATGSSLGNVSTVANGTIALSNTGKLVYTGTGNTTDRVIDLSGTTAAATPTLDQSGTGLLKFTGAFTATGAATKTFTLQGSTVGAGEIAGAIVDNSGTNKTSLTKAGTGLWTLSGANTYTGVTAINAGILQFAKETSLYNNTPASWTAANLTVASAATAAFNVGGTGEFTSADIQALSALSNVADGVTATTGFKTGSIIGLDTTNAGGTFTYAAVLANHVAGATTDTLGLAKLGTGTLSLTAVNTYSGTTSIAAGGVLSIAGAGQLNSGTYAATIANNGTLDYASSADQILSGVISGVGSLVKNGTGKLTLSVGNTFTGNVTINAGTVSTGATQGSGTNGYLGANNTTGRTVTINAGATLTMPSNNVFGGGTQALVNIPTLVINGGTVTAAAYNVIGNVTLNGGTLNNTNATGSGYSGFEFRNGSTVAVIGTAASTLSATQADHINGTVIFDVADVTASTAADLTVSARLINSSSDNGGAAGTLIKNGLGTVNFTSAASTSLPTNVTINAGTAVFSGSGFGADKMAGSGILTVNSGAGAVFSTAHALGGDNANMTDAVVVNAGGTLTLNAEQYLNNLTLNGGVINGSNEIRTSAASNIQVGGSSASTISSRVNLVNAGNFVVADVTGSAASDLNVTGIVTNTGALNKSGAGTMTLSGASTYTGATNVTAGTLLVSGSISGSSTTVGSGATLGGRRDLNGSGSDNITGSVAVNGGGTLMIGDGNGVSASTTDGLSINGNLTLADNSQIRLTLGADGAHTTLLQQGGTWTFSSGQLFSVIDSGAQIGSTYDDIILGLTTDPGVALWTLTGGYAGTFTYDGGGGVDLVLTAVPEPGAAVSLLGGVALLLGWRRRRSKFVQ